MISRYKFDRTSTPLKKSTVSAVLNGVESKDNITIASKLGKDGFIHINLRSISNSSYISISDSDDGYYITLIRLYYSYDFAVICDSIDELIYFLIDLIYEIDVVSANNMFDDRKVIIASYLLKKGY